MALPRRAKPLRSRVAPRGAVARAARSRCESASIRHTTRGTLRGMLDVLIPPRCVACRSATGVARGDPLCATCRSALPWLSRRDRCGRCGLPERHGPRACPARRQAFVSAFSAVAYAGPVPSLVLALKDRGALPVAALMAAQLAAAAPPQTWAGTLVPVPPDPWRRRRRGVDHTGAIASALGRRVEAPVAAVLRRGRGSAQAGRSRSARLRADVGVRTSARPPRIAVLVDDVHTTGATLHACAQALRAAGCGEVRAVAYARALT
jgi:predicted amidophosphoribosyltransferase